MNDIWIIARFYLASLVFQFIGLGLLQPLMHKWQDKGYGVARLVGLIAAAIPLWFLGSIKIVPFNDITIVIFVVIMSALSFWLLRKYKFSFSKYMLVQEIIFLAIYIVWTLIRSTNSKIEGTEKMMNLAFMNSIERTEFFPPADPWFSGLTINYYYLGHYIYTFWGKFAGIAMAYAYNLSLNVIIAQTFIGTMSIIGELTGLAKKHFRLNFLLGFGVAAWLCFGSNLHYLYSWVDQVIIKGQEFNYWFPDGTRIIPFVIDEFPAYSVALGDLHGHYMGMPMITLFIALLFVSYKTKITSRLKVFMNLGISILLFSLYGINSWDFITVNFLFILLHFYQAITLKTDWKDKAINFLVVQSALFLPGIPFILPFLSNFKPAVSGIGIVPLTAPREFLPYLQMWGAFLIVNIFAVITFFITSIRRKLIYRYEIAALIKNRHNLVFAIILIIAALCLILGVEVFYVRDIFEKDNGAYFRTNTVFKFYFAAWNIWAIGTGYLVYAIFKAIYKNPWKFAFPYLMTFAALLLIIWVGSVLYIFEAVDDFYSWGKFKEGGKFKVAELLEGKIPLLYDDINGNIYIERTKKADYAIINWLNENVSGNAVVLEAVGDAYTYYARISTNTGLSTIMGWPTHQWQWRNNTKEIYERKDDVATIYQTKDEDEFTTLIDKYLVDYIVYSDLEQENYKPINLNLIKKYYDEVFSFENAKIFKYKYIESKD